MFWIALAAQLSAPVPIDQRTWFSAYDFPAHVRAPAAHMWLVPIRIEVAPDGSIRSCAVEATSGEPILDKRTCEIVSKRAKFIAARSSDGFAAYGAYRTAISWAITEDPQELPIIVYPDLELTVKRLPPGSKPKSLVRVMFLVDEQGRPSSCVPEPRRLDPTVDNPDLVSVACEELLKSYKAVPVIGPNGKPVPSVQDASVLFSQ